MSMIARKLTVAEPLNEVAVVVAVDSGDIRVSNRHGAWPARRAVSCLVAPAIGDEVLVALLPDGRSFVLAVLERDAAVGTDIAVDGDLRIATRNGTCTVEGAQGVGIRSAADVSIASRGFSLHAGEGRVTLGKLTALAGALVARLDSARVAARVLETVADRVSQTAERCFRKISELDQLRAERVDYRTEKEMCLRAENVLAGARQLVKVDGEQIHIG